MGCTGAKRQCWDDRNDSDQDEQSSGLPVLRVPQRGRLRFGRQPRRFMSGRASAKSAAALPRSLISPHPHRGAAQASAIPPDRTAGPAVLWLSALVIRGSGARRIPRVRVHEGVVVLIAVLGGRPSMSLGHHPSSARPGGLHSCQLCHTATQLPVLSFIAWQRHPQGYLLVGGAMVPGMWAHRCGRQIPRDLVVMYGERADLPADLLLRNGQQHHRKASIAAAIRRPCPGGKHSLTAQ